MSGPGAAVAVGVFDGLHLGHLEILLAARDRRPPGGRAVRETTGTIDGWWVAVVVYALLLLGQLPIPVFVHVGLLLTLIHIRPSTWGHSGRRGLHSGA